MKNLLKICICVLLGVSLLGCSKSGDATVKLSDYPQIQEKSERLMKEIISSQGVKEVGTSIKFVNASSNTKGFVAVHYSTTNDGEMVLGFDTDSERLESFSIVMSKAKAIGSMDFPALVLGGASLTDFSFSAEDLNSMMDIIQNLKTTQLSSITVSMKEIEGNFEFRIVR